MTGQVLVAGIGNIFLGDDGFGVEVARRLTERELPEDVVVADYGISGVHLAYDLMDEYRTTILIDAAPRGDTPGTIYVLEIDTAHPEEIRAANGTVLDAHGMQPDAVFALLDVLGGKAGRVFVVGCEPADLDARIGLSEPVSRAVEHGVDAVLRLIRTESASASARPTEMHEKSEMHEESLTETEV